MTTENNLKSFISENDKLLSALTVLLAIAGFVQNLSIQWLGNALLFITIGALLTVWTELYKCFPQKGTVRLMIFKNTISLGLIGIIFYWLIAFNTFWNYFLFIPVFLGLAYMCFTVLAQLKQFSFVKKLTGEKDKRNVWQVGFLITYGFGIFLGLSWLLYLSIGVSPVFTFLLNIIKLNFK
ncbi:MAG: hypothetical protein KBC78_03190 [Candidatus Pacebacteria bacterium]|nr:hypothetical protein [Candidatus Paceibacterota bacterium]